MIPAERAAPCTDLAPLLIVVAPEALAGSASVIADRFSLDGFEVRQVTGAGLRRDAATALRGVQGRAVGLLALGHAASLGLGLAREERVKALVVIDPGDDLLSADTARSDVLRIGVHISGQATGPREAIGRWRGCADRLGAALFEYPGPDALLDRLEAGDARTLDLVCARSLTVLRPALGPHYDLGRLFREHLEQEFLHRDADATMRTMVPEPYVNHVPTMTGGFGHDLLKRFYKYHFIPSLSTSRETTLIAETIGQDTVVLEMVMRFVHDSYHDYMLPGIPPTGKEVEIAAVVVAKFKGDKLHHEHIYWDQASLLAQLGLIAPEGLPITGREQAAKMIDPSLPSNELMRHWRQSEGLPV